jgi:hypothetical protein
MKYYLPLLTSSYFDGENNRTIPQMENNSGKTIIQTVSKSSFTPTNSFIITSSEGTIIVADPTSMPTPEELDLNPDAVTITHTHSNHTDPKFTDHLRCKNQLQQFKSLMLRTSTFTVLPHPTEGTISTKTPQTMLSMFSRLTD